MTLIDLQGKALYSGDKEVQKAYLGSKSIYRKKGTSLVIPRYDYSTIKPEAVLVEYDYTNPEGNKLGGTHDGTYQDGGYYQSPLRFSHLAVPELSRPHPGTSGRAMVYEYVLNTPEYNWTGYRSLLHLDLATTLSLNFYFTGTNFRMDYYYMRGGIAQSGVKYTSPVRYADGVLVIDVAHTTVTTSISTLRVFINGVLVLEDSGPNVRYHTGRLNYDSSNAKITSGANMTNFSAEGILYESAMYDLDLYANPNTSQLETLSVANFERAKALYGK